MCIIDYSRMATRQRSTITFVVAPIPHELIENVEFRTAVPFEKNVTTELSRESGPTFAKDTFGVRMRAGRSC